MVIYNFLVKNSRLQQSADAARNASGSAATSANTAEPDN